MFRNYLKVALRNLWKNKGYSAINIFGLAIGLSTCLMITLYVADELSYDRYNKNANRIYRVDADIKFGGDLQKLAVGVVGIGGNQPGRGPRRRTSDQRLLTRIMTFTDGHPRPHIFF